MDTMHLFAGAGGGLLSDRILGHNPIIAVEWEPYACQVLRERAAEGWFPNLQVWEGDVRLFDPSQYAGRVDCIHAGFPCQDISVAGKQAGVGPETRSGLYREVLRIAGVVRPRYLFIENVAAIVTNGLGAVLADLAALGYDSEWLCLRASDCGALHHRDRWWLLADSGKHRRWFRKNEHLSGGELKTSPNAGAYGPEEPMADPEKLQRNGLNYHTGISMEHRSLSESGNYGRPEVVADAMRQRQPGQGQLINSSDCAAGSQWQASDAVNECVAGFWQVEPNVGRVADGVASRVDRLKAIGNGQVPLQAAVAWKLLGGP